VDYDSNSLFVHNAMKILTLGAAGFIGSHLTHRLLQEGHTVTAVDLTAEKVAEDLNHPRLTFLQQDIRSPEWDLDRLVRGADLVIDLIAYANPGLYLRIPLEVFRLNFTENLKIAEACVRHGKRLIQFSTCEVYGRTAASLKNAGSPVSRATRKCGASRRSWDQRRAIAGLGPTRR
jgi:nucleoside-diphosphate-sugar epimerase